jgi:hypothetical protein
MLVDTDDFITELAEVKRMKIADDLRAHIERKLINPNSPFKDLHSLRDIFKPKINNEITGFTKLLEMCNKAEELEIDYDLKEKLRYIISDIILNKK